MNGAGVACLLLTLVLFPVGTKAGEAGVFRPAKSKGPNGHVLLGIPAGDYTVGYAGDTFHPQRVVKLKAYQIADAETTNGQFAKFVEATGYVTDAERTGLAKTFREGLADWVWKPDPEAFWRKPFGVDVPNAPDWLEHPVTQISGADAQAYCKWAGLRLPTLNEWEVAARAGANTIYPWGAEYEIGKANIWNGKNHRLNTKEDGFVYTSPVRHYEPNAWGLYDVVGNVFEYCAGLPPGLVYPRGRPPDVISGRGGSWWCSSGTCSFFNCRDIGTMARRVSLPNQGFRVAADEAGEKATPESPAAK